MSRFTFFFSMVAALLLLVSNTLAVIRLDGVHPLTILPCDGPIVIGAPTTLRVTLSGPATGNEVVTVTSSTGIFIGLPAIVSPQSGQTYVDVHGILLLNWGPVAEFKATI